MSGTTQDHVQKNAAAAAAAHPNNNLVGLM
jgi:hypothetical protein